MLALLDTFSPVTPVQTLSEAAQSAGLPLSTAHRFLYELVRWGALTRDDDGRYRVGRKLWELGSLPLSETCLREVALPYMGDVFDATGENVHLSSLDGSTVLFLARVASRRSVPTNTPTGARMTALPTATGRVLLAYADPEVREAALAGEIPRHTDSTVTDPDALRSELDRITRIGHAVADQQISDAAIAVAAPIRDRAGDVVAALAVVATRTTTSVNRLIPVIQSAATGISRALGYTPQG